MSKTGPIIVVDDDPDDQAILVEILQDLKVENQIISFKNGRDAFDFLLVKKVRPFIILSDVNMPVIDGIKLRQLIKADKDLYSIPFVFISTTATSREVDVAYDMTVQGFFQKASSYEAQKARIKRIIEYWSDCITPYSIQRF